MYSNITLYYLNQIGIRPWIKRVNFMSDQDSVIKQEHSKLIVFVAANLNMKAQILLKQIMTYMNISESELTIILSRENDSFSNYNQRIKQKNPLAIWVLGLNQKKAEAELNLTCPIFTSADPEYLLIHPGEKRQIFKDISYIKQLIARSDPE